MFTISDCFSAYLQNSKKALAHHNWFLIKCIRLVNSKGVGFRTQSSKSCKVCSKNTARDIIYDLVKFYTQMIKNSKAILKNVLYLVC